MYKLNSETFDYSIIKRMISKLSINIFPHKNGLFLLVTSSNEKAQKFYLKLGYAEI